MTPSEKEELLKIAETCERVPAKPPRTLQESFQYDIFIQMMSGPRPLKAHGRPGRIIITGRIMTRM
ncbi:MAG: pyruvate formate lyase family protein [Desulfobacterales bacterium]